MFEKRKMATVRRINMTKIQFDVNASKPTPLEIHWWIHNNMKLKANQIQTIQLVTQERAVYLKTSSKLIYERLLQSHEGSATFRYDTGEQTKINISAADNPAITVRISDLPKEISHDEIKTALQKYGTIQTIRYETWSTGFPYPVENGIRALKMEIKKHIETRNSVFYMSGAKSQKR
ncbi:hypothetical protein C0J52_25432 [Blattella germanica]|nr:hypothetical protein C0J52_25432 [Blattella germanica]